MMSIRPSLAPRKAARPSPASRKGQYFSADAIIASFIFVMALSLLTAQWFSLRAQAQSPSVSLLDDANRISDLLMVPGNPGDWYSWSAYSSSSAPLSAGFGLNGTRGGTLNQTTLVQAAASINSDSRLYNRSRQLMALPDDYYIVFDNLSSLDPAAPAYQSTDFPYIAIGRAPSHPTDRVQVYRGVLVPVVNASVTPPITYYYYGIMTVTVWTNKSNI